MTKEQETEYERQQHEAWKEYASKHHPINSKEEFDQLLNDPSVIFIAGDGIPVLKLVNNDHELLEFLLRFVHQSHHTGALSNYWAADDWFRDLICHKDDIDHRISRDDDDDDEEVEEHEIIDTVVNAPAKLLDHSEFAHECWNGYSWHERTYSGFTANDYKLLFKPEYPCLVRVELIEDRDRTGPIKINHTTITPLSSILSNKMFVNQPLESSEDDDC
jgi:hypothetical protein